MYKNKRPVFPDNERLEIIRSCRYVDDGFLNDDDPGSLESYAHWVMKFGVRKIFIGSDWQGTDKYGKIGALLKEFDCELIYLPYTGGISTTDIVRRISADKPINSAEVISLSPQQPDETSGRDAA